MTFLKVKKNKLKRFQLKLKIHLENTGFCNDFSMYFF
jgi:hypothetical protein